MRGGPPGPNQAFQTLYLAARQTHSIAVCDITGVETFEVPANSVKAILAGLPDEVMCTMEGAFHITTVRQLCDFRSKEAFEQ